MKHISQFIISLLLFAGAVQAQDAPKTWALLVGVGSYINPQISTLRFPAKDALSLRDALINPKIGGLPRDQVLMLADNEATRSKITEGVTKFLKNKVNPGDNVVVFLAGHGVAKGAGTEAKSYFLPYDTKGLTTESLDKSAVNLREFADELGTIKASQIVVFVDACREDPTPGRGIKGNIMTDVVSRSVMVVPDDPQTESATFFACSAGQRAYEDATLGHGVFTSGILDGLEQGPVPKQNGEVHMVDLSSHVLERVKDWAKKTSNAGDFEVEQTPELVTASPLKRPILHIKRPPAGAPVKAAPVKIIASPPLVEGGDQAADFYNRAVKAESRQQWEVAEQGYKAAIGANPKLVVAHDALGELHRLQGRNADAVADALNLVANVPGIHALSALSRAYSRYAESGAGAGNTATAVKPVGKFKLPRNEKEAMFSAINAANDAVDQVKKEASSGAVAAEAHRAQGYALTALDTEGKNKKAAIDAFGNAVLLDENDAANHLAYGYGIRYYGAQQKDEDSKKDEMERAIKSLEEAVKLRPNYYDAHRELAFCHTMLGNTDAALESVEKANGNRGAAANVGEIVALEVAAAGMHQKAAENSAGEEKAGHQAASEGYMAEAKEKDPELKTALKILNMVGLGQQIGSLLPDKWKNVFDPKGAAAAAANAAANRIPEIPGVGGFKRPKIFK